MSNAEDDVPAASPGLGGVAVRGAGNLLTGQLLRIVLQFVAVAVLSRLLSPRDYGLLAMVMVVIGLGEVFRDFGLSTAAVQARVLLRPQRDALFFLSSAIGLAFGLILFLAAPLVALWFSEPDLVVVSRALSVVFVLNGMTSQYRADLNRSLRFRALVGTDIAGQATGLAIAIVLALGGAGYWALVAQQVTAGIVTLTGSVVLCRWLPRPPPRGTQVRPLLRFGLGLSASQVVGYLSSNVDNIIIGTQLGTEALGQYNRGYQILMRVVNQVRGPSTSVAVPVLSTLADEPDRFDDYLVKGQAALGYTLVAGLAFVAAAANPIVNIVLGPGWEAVGPVLAWLSVAAAFQTISYIGYWIYIARGLTGRLFWYNVLALAIRIGCLAIASYFGIAGIAAGMAVAAAIGWPISFAWISRFTQVPARRLYVGAFWIVLTAGLVAGSAAVALMLADGTGNLVQLGVAAAGALAGYAIALTILPPARREVWWLYRLARRTLRRSRAK